MERRAKHRLGLLVPFTNTNFEPDMTMLFPDDVTLHTARLGGYDANEVPDHSQMAGLGTSNLDEPLRLLGGVKPDAVIYGCTSATLTLGPAFDQNLANDIEEKIGAATVTAAGALRAALDRLEVSQIGFASPYVAAINDMAIGFLAHSGVTTVARSEVAKALSNDEQGAMTPSDVYQLALKADHKDAQALVLSCTDMRSVETIARLEAKLGKPVVTSNQAIAFQTRRKLGLTTPVSGFGQLLERYL